MPYVDDSQIYNYDHQGDDAGQGHDPNRTQSRTAHSSPHDYNQNHAYQDDKGYYSYGDQQDDDDDDEMW